MWNNDFDFITLHNRLKRLGHDPSEFFSSSDFPYKYSYYRQDKFSKDYSTKNSQYITASHTNWIDQLALYASLNKANGVIESYKLEDIGMKEVGEGKETSEEGVDMFDLYNTNYRLFMIYNIQDTILLAMIEAKVKNIDLLYQLATIANTRISHVLKKTVSLRNLADKFYSSNGYTISNNRSKLYPKAAGKIAGASTL